MHMVTYGLIVDDRTVDSTVVDEEREVLVADSSSVDGLMNPDSVSDSFEGLDDCLNGNESVELDRRAKQLHDNEQVWNHYGQES